MNLQAEAQLLCLEIGDGSRRLNMFGNKTRANMKSHICPVHICPLAYNYRNMDCSARLVLSLLAGPNNGQSCDNILIYAVFELRSLPNTPFQTEELLTLI
jgi:hypothetical protein